MREIDMDLKPVLIDLSDIYTQLLENDYEMKQVIALIR